MAGRSGDTFKKRQKEVARAEKRQEKTARRMERKLQKRAVDANGAPIEGADTDFETEIETDTIEADESGSAPKV